MMAIAKKYKIVTVFLFVEVILFVSAPDISKRSWTNSIKFMLEIFTVLPPVVLLIGLLDAWLPRSAIESYLGRKSGPKGMVVATLLGSGAAGPLFSAFPIAAALLNKGSRVANVVIFLGSWATIKLPMILMESQFLGLKFSLLRTAITLPFIIWIGILMERFAPPVSRYFPADFVDFKPQ